MKIPAAGCIIKETDFLTYFDVSSNREKIAGSNFRGLQSLKWVTIT